MIGAQQEYITYVLQAYTGEYYCGKTYNLNRRIIEHKQGKKGTWFGFKKRNKLIKVCLTIKGDYEKEIKRFGVEKFYMVFSKLTCDIGLEVPLL